MKLVTLDFETYWSADVTLKKQTPIEYILHPEFEVQSMSIKLGDGPTRFYRPHQIPGVLAQIDWSDTACLAHNGSGFDFLILSLIYNIFPRAYLDTLAMARPLLSKRTKSGLGYLATFLGLSAKGDLEGDVNVKGRRASTFTEEEWARMEAYNNQDVDLCYEVFQRLKSKLPKREMALIHYTALMATRPQIQLDTHLLETTLYAEKRRAEQMLQELGAQMGYKDASVLKKHLSSRDQFAGMIEQLGYQVPMKLSPKTKQPIPAVAATDEGMSELLEHPDERVQVLAAARLETASTLLRSRAQRLLVSTVGPDKRLPILLNYCGAYNTWRWSGGGKLNQQNLPRPSGKPTDALRQSFRAPPGYKIVTSDLSGIELRVNHFLWQVPATMAAYRRDAKADLYKDYAAWMYHVRHEDVTKAQRTFAKLCMLSLGYQTGVAKFSDACRLADVQMTTAEVKDAIYKWRERYVEIQRGWDRCVEMLPLMQAGITTAVDAWGLFETCHQGLRFVPYGSVLDYPGLCEGYKHGKGVEWYYHDRSRNRTEEKLFGGKMTENMVSHISRQIMADAMLTYASSEWGSKYPIAHCVHDEIIVVPREEDAQAVYAYLNRLLSTPPVWWPELVVYSEGGVADNYLEAK